VANSITLQGLQQEVLNVLDEALNSPSGALQTGAGGTPVKTTPQTLTYWINDAIGKMTRECVAVVDTATYAYTPGTYSLLLRSAPSQSGGEMWAVTNASFGGTTLQRSNSGRGQLLYSWPVPLGVPAQYWADGQMNIVIAPTPVVAGNLLCKGFIVPAPLVNPDDTAAWIGPDEATAIAHYAAFWLVGKNLSDPKISQAEQFWINVYNEKAMALWQRLQNQSPSDAANYFAKPPQPMQMQAPQGQ
jgi:hypothetical protein